MFSAKANAAGTRFVYWVECNGSMCKCSPKTENYYTKEEAAKAWNKRASDWIPCSERMPENGQRVLIRSSSNRFFDVIYHSDIQYPNFTLKIFGHTYAWDYRDVISWKPLPYPPEENDA